LCYPIILYRAPAVRPPRLERVIGLTLLHFFFGRVIGLVAYRSTPSLRSKRRAKDRSSAWQPTVRPLFFFISINSKSFFGRAPAVRPPRLERVIGLTLLPFFFFSTSHQPGCLPLDPYNLAPLLYRDTLIQFERDRSSAWQPTVRLLSLTSRRPSTRLLW
jgi:hypothetical protein